MIMNRETLRAHLNNSALVQIVKAKQGIDSTRKDLCNALATMQVTGISKVAIDEVQNKIEKYGKISRNYGYLLEDLWGITWHWESTIEKFIGSEDYDIDKLPEYIRPA